MKIISIANLKGGVGKSTTTINLGDNLAKKGYKVLVIDNDKQGNTTDFFNLLDENRKGTHTLLLENVLEVKELICKSAFENLDVMPTSMMLQFADNNASSDKITPLQQKYRTALKIIENEYDYCIIDNAPSLDTSVVNALVCSDLVIIPIKVDNFSNMGLKIFSEQLEQIRRHFNSSLNEVYTLFTMCNNSIVNVTGKTLIESTLHNLTPNITYTNFETSIRRTVLVDESTFYKEPLSDYARKQKGSRKRTCEQIAKDYENLADEIIEFFGEPKITFNEEHID